MLKYRFSGCNTGYTSIATTVVRAAERQSPCVQQWKELAYERGTKEKLLTCTDRSVYLVFGTKHELVVLSVKHKSVICALR